MKIYLSEITPHEKELDFTQADEWVRNAVYRIDERSDDTAPSTTRAIQVYFNLRQVDDVSVVEGKIETFIELVCSRCANSFQHACKLKFSALFCRDPIMAGVAHLHKLDNDPHGVGKPMGQNQGFARHAHHFADDDIVMEGKDVDITYLSHDYIDLGDVIGEQLQLQVPFQPLCKEKL